MQQPFGPYKVGELTVPGAMRLFTIPTPMAIGDQHAWGEIHPPQIAADSHARQSSTVALSAASAKHQTQSLAGLLAGLLVLATLGAIVAGALLMLVGRRLLPEALRLRHLVPFGRSQVGDGAISDHLDRPRESCLERWVEGGL